MKQPVIDVGVLTAGEIAVVFKGGFVNVETGEALTGKTVFLAGDMPEGEEVRFKPADPESCEFEMLDVVIGKGFHWERREDQVFKGALKIIREGDDITAINMIHAEEYLKSVISSEMSADAPMESLKAHAVISRSWLLSQLESKSKTELTSVVNSTEDELIMWFDREAHDNYDVCADDHCQRYQGITRAYSENAAEAVAETCGIVLMHDGYICDARYSKCCGGVTENFENVWEDERHPYLESVPDFRPGHPVVKDLAQEDNAAEWITGSPSALCNTADREFLSHALNDYDMETPDFFRWNVSYTQDELSNIVKLRTGIDFGDIEALVPLERGASGRIIKLRIEGSVRTMTIGKELYIRKALSRTHLYSSAFIVETTRGDDGVRFTLHGAGWGHGVGLCQIGAAVMGREGAGYGEILSHYYPGASAGKVY